MPQSPLFGPQVQPRRRSYQDLMIEQLLNTANAPTQGHLQGINKALAGALAGYSIYKQDADEKAKATGTADTLAQALRATKTGWTNPPGGVEPTNTPGISGETPMAPGQTVPIPGAQGGMQGAINVLMGNPNTAAMGANLGFGQLTAQQALANAIAKSDAEKGLTTQGGQVVERPGFGAARGSIEGATAAGKGWGELLPEAFKSMYATREVQPGGQVVSPMAQALGQGAIPLPPQAAGMPVPGPNSGVLYQNNTMPPAPQINVSQSADKGLATGLAEIVAKDLGTSRGQATSAVGMLKNADVLKTLLDKGMITGTAGDVRLAVNRGLATMGIISPDQVGNTEAFQATVGKQVLELVKNLGAGTSISNADREYAAKIAGGDIALSETGIRRILDIGRRAAEESITMHNMGVEKQRGAPGVSESVLRHFTVDMPKPGSYQVPELGNFPMPSTPAQRGPQPGAVEGGYRFKGGNPADPNSWEKVQ